MAASGKVARVSSVLCCIVLIIAACAPVMRSMARPAGLNCTQISELVNACNGTVLNNSSESVKKICCTLAKAIDTRSVTGNQNGNLSGNLSGNLAGNLLGIISGNLSGNLVGNLAGIMGAIVGAIARVAPSELTNCVENNALIDPLRSVLTNACPHGST